ncbi:MAG: cold shock domain-containing protein [Cytophagales bacterium]|nr:MAG: cold shock domain-containing protein [Cytophagales bacterium]
MKTGKVKFFNGAKGYGFIIDDGDQKEIFVHVSELQGGTSLNEGDAVSFEIKRGKKGLNAVNVTRI